VLFRSGRRCSSDACCLTCTLFFPRQERRRFGGLVGAEKDSSEVKSLAGFGNAHRPICGTLLHLWLHPPTPAFGAQLGEPQLSLSGKKTTVAVGNRSPRWAEGQVVREGRPGRVAWAGARSWKASQVCSPFPFQGECKN